MYQSVTSCLFLFAKLIKRFNAIFITLNSAASYCAKRARNRARFKDKNCQFSYDLM